MTPEQRKEARRESYRRHYEANREKVLEKNRRYQEANREKILEQRRRYREANPEKIREQRRRWREANREKKRERDRRYYEANREKVLEKARLRTERLRAEGLCIICGKEPGERGLRESGVCRPCHGRHILNAELRGRSARMEANSDLFEAMLGALSSGDGDLATLLAEGN